MKSAYDDSAALHLPDRIRNDALAFRNTVEAYLRNEMTEKEFHSHHVGMGIYEHREKGRFMVRVRIGAGIVLSGQLIRIAELSHQYGSGILHVTTRQDIQIHGVTAPHLADVVERLLEVGLASRGGGGNTVRNITACFGAGLCTDELFDVSPYAVAVAEYLLQNERSFMLPRKFKIAFSGCEKDCALASVADTGFFARIQDGKHGFTVYAGGGLGVNPRVGICIEEFVPAENVFAVAEAVRRLFDKYGNRANRNRARLRYVLADAGEEAFRELYRQEREILREQGLPGEIPAIRKKIPHVPNGRAIPVPLVLGHITADALTVVAETALRFGTGEVRTTQLQDLLIPNIPEEVVPRVLGLLSDAGLGKGANGHPKIVACTGASTCRLGICRSRDLAQAIGDHFHACGIVVDNASSPVVRISGCPNSCAAHQIAEVGLQGSGRRINGILVPHYTVYVGGSLSGQGARLGEKVATVPARRIPELLADCLANGKIDPVKLRMRAPHYEEPPADLPETYWRDFGSENAFTLPGRAHSTAPAEHERASK